MFGYSFGYYVWGRGVIGIKWVKFRGVVGYFIRYRIVFNKEVCGFKYL